MSAAQTSFPSLGTIAVCETGVTWGRSFIAFLVLPLLELSRGDLARLLGMNDRSIKRLEKRSPALRSGRRTKNQRVLRYSIESVIAFLAEEDHRVDLLEAIRLGLPLNALAPDKYGYRTHERETAPGAVTHLLAIPANVVQQVLAAWETWRALNSPAVSPTTPVPLASNLALDQITTNALAALIEARPTKPHLAKWANEMGRSANQLEYSVADVARRLGQRLRTPEGQLLFALLLHTAAA